MAKRYLGKHKPSRAGYNRGDMYGFKYSPFSLSFQWKSSKTHFRLLNKLMMVMQASEGENGFPA